MGWNSDALREFHELWATSPDPAAVRAAREAAERLLAADPSGAGRHLSEGLWRLRVPPLLLCALVALALEVLLANTRLRRLP